MEEFLKGFLLFKTALNAIEALAEFKGESTILILEKMLQIEKDFETEDE